MYAVCVYSFPPRLLDFGLANISALLGFGIHMWTGIFFQNCTCARDLKKYLCTCGCSLRCRPAYVPGLQKNLHF